MQSIQSLDQPTAVSWRVALQNSVVLMKPYTWFAPAWAYVVGCIASHSIYFNFFEDPLRATVSLGRIAIGTLMAGPLLTGFSQVINEWCDRDVDAVNQPERLIPSGKVNRSQIVVTLFVLAMAALTVGLFLGVQVAGVCLVGLVLAWGYSANPLRFKRNGWIGNLATGLAYESLAWVAGHLSFGTPISTHSLMLAVIYGLGAHGIMTINDFKSVAGDRQFGLRSLPVLYGEQAAARLAVFTINAAQVAALALMVVWGFSPVALALCGLCIVAQIPVQLQLIRTPTQLMAVRYNIVAIPPYVWGMLFAAIWMR